MMADFDSLENIGEEGESGIVPPKTDVKAVAKFLSSDVVNSSGFLVRSKCKVCNSPQRAQAEEMFENKASGPQIKKFLEDNGTIVAVQNVNHHMREHYGSAERMLALYEYCENLSAMMEKRKSREEDLEVLVNISKIEIARIVSLKTNNTLSKEKERNSMLMNAMKSMKDAIVALNAMSDADAKAQAIQQKFLDTWKDMIADAPDDSTRTVYINALKNFRDAVEGTSG
jgi:hypothetical protein